MSHIQKHIYIYKLIYKLLLHLKFQEGNLKQLHVYMFQLQSTERLHIHCQMFFTHFSIKSLQEVIFLFWQNIYFYKFSIPWLWIKLYISASFPFTVIVKMYVVPLDKLGSILTAGEQSVSPFIVSSFLKLPKYRCFWTFIISYEISGEILGRSPPIGSHDASP